MIFGKRKGGGDDSAALIAGILDSLDCAVAVVRPAEGRVLMLNRAARELLPEALRDEVSCERGFPGGFLDMQALCPGRRTDRPAAAGPMDIRGENDRIYEVAVNTLPWTDGKPAAVFFLRDVTEARGVHQRLYDLAYKDPLTAMPNRRKLKEDFEALEGKIAEGRLSGAICIIDLDNFKAVNDTYGHSTGDFMLRAFTEHLQGDPAFRGHLYRLGGDEFALLYAEANFRPNPQAYYSELLQNAVRTYSMPNIDIVCTISMGVSFFPQHGGLYSDLLRKADIALYGAKEAGRNQISLFSAEMDSAKTFRDVYIAIRPVLDLQGRTFGYELVDNGSGDPDGTDVVNLSELNRTVDTLGLDDLSSSVKYFIAYTRQMLSSPPPAQFKSKFILEIHMPPDVNARELDDFRRLRALGFKVCVSGLGPENLASDFLELCDYVKLRPAAFNGDMQKKLIAGLPGKQFIATEVDTAAAFDAARQIGYTLFQGYYFNEARPVTAKTKDIEPIRYNYFRLLQLTATDDYVDFAEISQVIASDLALSYKLLKLLNSAALALPNRISSISMAVAYLGEENLKKWISLLGMRGVAPGKPLELVRMSLVRARFGELLAPHFKARRDTRHVFLTGMLSLLDVALDRSMEEVMAEMPVHEDIVASLLTKSGPHADLIAFFKHYEYANWEDVARFTHENGLTSRLVGDSYAEAVKWAGELIDAY